MSSAIAVLRNSVAIAAIAVLRHNGVPVYVPARQCGSGAAALVQGDTDVARERLVHNVRRLADAGQEAAAQLANQGFAS